MALNKRFTDIITNTGNEVGDTSSSFATRLKVYANNRYNDIINKLILADVFEIYRTATITTTASIATYNMPYDYGTPVYVANTTSGGIGRALDIIREQEWILKYSRNLTQQSAPVALVTFSNSNPYNQPTASASKLDMFSSSSSDTTESVFIRGISGSAEYYETVNLSGTSTATSSNTYDYVLQIGKSGATVGAVQIIYHVDGVVASVISPQATEQRFSQARFHYVPDATYTMSIRYRRDMQPMVNDNDYPIIDIGDIIELGTKADAWRTKRFFANASDFEQRYLVAIEEYANRQLNSISQQFDVYPYPRNETYGGFNETSGF